MSLRRTLECLAVAGWLAGMLFLARVWACMEFFPRRLLMGEDLAVLAPPVADFRLELKRIELPVVPPFRAIPPRQDPFQQTTEVDHSDLRAALQEMGLSERQQKALLAQYQALRESLRSYAVTNFFLRAGGMDPAESPQQQPGPLRVPEGLPGEFADYLRGAIAYWQGHMDEARAAWQSVLDRPASQRRYRSTWAAFMIGKSWLQSDPVQAIVWFERVRDLAQQGFIDNLGLAAASLGWQAKAELDRKRYDRAMELYLAQFAVGEKDPADFRPFGASMGIYLMQFSSGDSMALLSLIQVAKEVFAAGPETLRQMATHPTAQRVITAYILSRGGIPRMPTSPPTSLVKAWLDAVEANAATPMEGAERLAWVAYQAGEMKTARRWLDRARPDEAMTLWLRAKLLLYDGRIDQAVPLLARVARRFPPSERWRDLPESHHWEMVEPYRKWEMVESSWEEVRNWQDNPYWWGEISPSHQALGELGVLQLSRRAYTEAFDALLRAGFWLDAAYVAEQVLTPEELIAYVDRHWPPRMPPKRARSMAEREGSTIRPPGKPELWPLPDYRLKEIVFEPTPDKLAVPIRHLLARRLVRIGRWKEARNYYPSELRSRFDLYAEGMRARQDRRLPAQRRAEAFWQAARITRHEGMELLGTEIEPDWRALSGDFELETVSSVRGVPEPAKIVRSSQDERDRLRHHLPPKRRFHYRYTAADLAWEAAALMPDQSEATARVLCIAGSWLKYSDPKAADRFYKALVKRCGRTELGRQADRLRWFPVIQ